MEHNPPKEKARAPQQRANSKNKQSTTISNNAASQRQKRLLDGLELNELWAVVYERNIRVRFMQKYLMEVEA